MKKNVGNIDKVVRVIIAFVASYFAYTASFEAAWMEYALWAVAIIMLLTTLIGSCPIYSLLGQNTCKVKE
ncbi:MAG: DUF2892 domain-containing protein [Flavobacteriaceae bacterium]|nr:DUF2892 domain-containing protein [Flavobacteriaceae bacterium]